MLVHGLTGTIVSAAVRTHVSRTMHHLPAIHIPSMHISSMIELLIMMATMVTSAPQPVPHTIHATVVPIVSQRRQVHLMRGTQHRPQRLISHRMLMIIMRMRTLIFEEESDGVVYALQPTICSVPSDSSVTEAAGIVVVAHCTVAAGIVVVVTAATVQQTVLNVAQVMGGSINKMVSEGISERGFGSMCQEYRRQQYWNRKKLHSCLWMSAYLFQTSYKSATRSNVPIQ